MRPEHIHCPRCRRLNFERLEPRLALAGGGLTAQYFFNSDFTGLAGTQNEAVSHNWGTGSPGFGIAADNFSVRWTGQVEAQFSQSYTFRLLSDAGVRFWVNGQLLVDNWTAHTVRTDVATMTLQAGQRYDIRVDYFEDSGPAQIDLSWSSASQPLQTVPAARLYDSPAGLLGTYRDSVGGGLSRVDAGVDFNWGSASPGPGIAANGFTVNWTGQIRADFGDTYTFSTISDEGVRLRIGDELVIDDWSAHTAKEDLGVKWLEPGKWYDFRLEYYDATGAAQIQLRWSSLRQTGANVFQAVPQANLLAAQPAGFDNPLGAGADPWVTYWDGNYYMVRSQGNSVWINRAASLEDIHQSSGHSQTTLAWSAPVGTSYSQQIWAPELHRMGSNWYIYVAASDGNNSTHRMQVLERIGDNPFGPFTRLGQIGAATDRWAIDGTVFDWNGVWYFVWSGWPGSTDGQQNLYIAEMRNPWTLQSDRVLISTPQYAWEKNGLPINEGPEILIHDGQLHIIYSASGYWTNQYALGRLTYNGTGSLLSASSWAKASQPVFQATSQVTGPGHASFTKSPDGTEDWIVYHAHANPTTFNEDRVIRIQPFTFNADGTPNFGQPVPPGQLVAVPSAGPDPERPILAGDYQADGLVNGSDYNLWRATFGGAMFPGVAADGNTSGTADAGDYVLWRKSASSVNQLSIVADSPATLASDLTSPSTTEVVPSERLISAPIQASTNITRRPSASAWRSAAITSDDGEYDDALVAWISSATDRRRPSGDSAAMYQRDESQSDDEATPLVVALDAIFAPVIL
jgi:GH43 family beta-xylosidase